MKCGIVSGTAATDSGNNKRLLGKHFVVCGLRLLFLAGEGFDEFGGKEVVICICLSYCSVLNRTFQVQAYEEPASK